MHNEAWTPDIDALATRLRRDDRLSAKAIATRLGRTPGAVSARLLKLGVTIHARTEWNAQDEGTLRDLVEAGELSIRAVARTLGRTECSVRWKIDDLGLKPGRLRPWTREDDLRALASASKPDAALRILADEIGRSYDALRARLVHLGVRRKATWDKGTVAGLRALAARGVSLDEAATELGREPGSVRSKAYALGLRFSGPGVSGKVWDMGSDAELRAVVRTRGTGAEAVSDAAAATGHSIRSVRGRMRTLGLSQPRRRRPLDEAGREEILAAARAGSTLSAAARDLGRDARILKEVAAMAGMAFEPSVRQPPRATVRSRPATVVGGPLGEPLPTGHVYRGLPAASAIARGRVRRAEPAVDRAVMDDAIARFLRERGVTRADPGGLDETVRRIRARGYAVTGGTEAGFVVDGRHALAGLDELRAFAEARGIVVPSALEGAQ